MTSCFSLLFFFFNSVIFNNITIGWKHNLLSSYQQHQVTSHCTVYLRHRETTAPLAPIQVLYFKWLVSPVGPEHVLLKSSVPEPFLKSGSIYWPRQKTTLPRDLATLWLENPPPHPTSPHTTSRKILTPNSLPQEIETPTCSYYRFVYKIKET